MSVQILTQENFSAEVSRPESPILVDFWAPWCGYCRRIAPAVEAIAAEQAGTLRVGTVNVDEQPGLAEQFQVMTIPSLFIFRAGEAVGPLVAPTSKAQVEGWLKENGAL